MDPSAPLSKQQYIGTLKQWHRQVRRSYRQDIKNDVSVADDDKRLTELTLIRSLLALAGDRMNSQD